jgi:hypothetical protein
VGFVVVVVVVVVVFVGEDDEEDEEDEGGVGMALHEDGSDGDDELESDMSDVRSLFFFSGF